LLVPISRSRLSAKAGQVEPTALGHDASNHRGHAACPRAASGFLLTPRVRSAGRFGSLRFSGAPQCRRRRHCLPTSVALRRLRGTPPCHTTPAPTTKKDSNPHVVCHTPSRSCMAPRLARSTPAAARFVTVARNSSASPPPLVISVPSKSGLSEPPACSSLGRLQAPPVRCLTSTGPSSALPRRHQHAAAQHVLMLPPAFRPLVRCGLPGASVFFGFPSRHNAVVAGTAPSSRHPAMPHDTGAYHKER
jgi:hypothetical protein